MHLWSKLTSEICQKVRSLNENTKQKHLQVPTFLPSFQETIVLLKNDKCLLIYYCKNKHTYKFCVFMIESALRNMSESNEFRFEVTLSRKLLIKNNKNFVGGFSIILGTQSWCSRIRRVIYKQGFKWVHWIFLSKPMFILSNIIECVMITHF